MVDFTGPGLDDYGSGSGFGTGEHVCPTGKHWDDKLQTCVDDIVVGNQPDGHNYEIQKSQNESGLDWLTVYEFDNATDADDTYATVVAEGGFWQMLVDGKMTKTNLPIDQRYDATKKKLDEDALKHEYSCEYLLDNDWSWFATATTLDAAIAMVKEAQAGTAHATISYGDYRIRDWNGDVVWSEKIDTPKPPGDTSSGLPSLENLDAIVAIILVCVVIGVVAWAVM